MDPRKKFEILMLILSTAAIVVLFYSPLHHIAVVSAALAITVLIANKGQLNKYFGCYMAFVIISFVLTIASCFFAVRHLIK